MTDSPFFRGGVIRDFLNAILAFIGAASLSDDEFNSLDLEVQTYSVEVYEGLLSVLDSREMVSNTRDRLRYYFLARGVEVQESSAGMSNIWAGSVLCE